MSRDPRADHPVEALSALLDGELPEDERARVEEHLRGCAPCRSLAADLVRLDRAVSEEAAPAVPADLAGRIRRRLASNVPAAAPAPEARVAGAIAGTPSPIDARRRRPWILARPAPLAAAAGLVVVALVWLAWPGRRMASGPPMPGPTTTESSMPASSPPASSAPAPSVPGPSGSAPMGPEKPSAIQSAEVGAPAAVAGGAGKPILQPGPASRDDRIASQPAPRNLPVPRGLNDTLMQKSGLAPIDAVAGVERARGRRDDGSTLPEAGLAAATVRALPAIEAPPYLVRLLPGGRMGVESGRFSCDVPLGAEDARLLASILAGATLARGSPPAPPAAFDRAATREGAAEPAGSAGAAPQAAPAAAARPAPVAADAPTAAAGATLGDPGETASPAAAPGRPASAAVPAVTVSPEAREAVLRLLRQRYRLALEERCGPLPR